MPGLQKPYRGQTYYHIDTNFTVTKMKWVGDEIDQKLWDAGNVFYDYGKAQAVADIMTNLIIASHLN